MLYLFNKYFFFKQYRNKSTPVVLSFIFLISHSFFCTGFVRASEAKVADLPEDLRKAVESRIENIEKSFEGTGIKGGPAAEIAIATATSELAVLAEAKKRNITVSEDEILIALIPYLTQQGLIDLKHYKSAFEDKNVILWLKGQKWKVKDLRNFGKLLALWIKLAVTNVEVSREEVRDFVTKNPRIAISPPKVKIRITHYRKSSDLSIASKGVLQAQLTNPIFTITRGDARKVAATSSKSWDQVELFLQIDRLDPNLRQALSSKSVNSRFGPVQTASGVVLAGQILEIVQETELWESESFWPYATLMARLNKVNKADKLNALIKAYVEESGNAALKGFWSTLGTLVGGGVGAIFGNPGLGLTLGNGVGQLIDGSTSRRTQRRLQVPTRVLGAINNVAQPYFQGQVSIPPMYGRPVARQPAPRQVNFMPPMPVGYAPGYSAFANRMSRRMAQPASWAPPFWMPMPMMPYY